MYEERSWYAEQDTEWTTVSYKKGTCRRPLIPINNVLNRVTYNLRASNQSATPHMANILTDANSMPIGTRYHVNNDRISRNVSACPQQALKKDTSVTFWVKRNFFWHAYDTSMTIIVTKACIIIDVVGSLYYDKKS